MISYHISAEKPTQHTFRIKLSFTATHSSAIIQVPFWRPGRYEAGNFTKNIIGLQAFSGDQKLKSRKTTGHTWEIETKPGQKVELRYNCYAAELTAGNTYLDEDLLLINPVNALVYILGMEEEEMQVALEINKTWKVATAMQPASGNHENGIWKYRCADLQELLDTPILAAADLETLTYRENGIDFHIDIYGEGIENKDKFKEDFAAFTRAQIAAFGGFPVDRYHFLTLLLPHKAYHGVEHETSTVVIMGPSSELHKRELYKELIGVSSHELYHTWNVKSLRPSDWTPYDFTGPGFSRLGYVAEGVTTYMGDWMLWQSRFFSDQEFLNEISTHLQRHIDNEGRFNLSLADSSVDTWVDGYGRGTPNRRVSIYVEGALVSLICDIKIMKATKGKKGLSDVMRSLYEKYGAKKGFTEEQYWAELKAVADIDWAKLREDLIDKTGLLQDYLNNALASIGLGYTAHASDKPWEKEWGVSIQNINGNWEVYNLMEGSPADEAGMWFGDKVSEIDGMLPDEFFAKADRKTMDGISLSLNSGFRTKKVSPSGDGKTWIFKYKVVEDNDSSQDLFKKWRTFLEKK